MNLTERAPLFSRQLSGLDVEHGRTEARVLAATNDALGSGVRLDLEALDAYTVHLAHQEVANLGKQIAEKVVSVDFFES